MNKLIIKKIKIIVSTDLVKNFIYIKLKFFLS